jgi:lysophospholipase L1-like esterase
MSNTPFRSSHADDTDASLIQPSHWNTLVSGAQQTALIAGRGLSPTLPMQPVALNGTPTISLANANPGSTPTSIVGWLRNNTPQTANPVFTFSGGSYIQGSPTFPYRDFATLQYRPHNTLGFGYAVVDFFSDAPVITFQHSRSTSSASRVFVDGVELYRCANAITAGTAQAGAASTITLAAGASATNGQYFNNWIHITGGTGVGQYRVITGYVGATKVATVGAAWATAPDVTSTYEITAAKAAYSNSTQTGFTDYFFTVDWAGERRLRRYRVEVAGFSFQGVFVPSAIDSVLPAPKPTGPACFWVGDSFGEGTGADASYSSMAKVCCDALGWEWRHLSISGTGFLNNGGTGANGSFTAGQRVTPPANAWQIYLSGATGGTYTLTQNSVTTGAIAYNATTATIQAALDAAFGAGTFQAVSGSAATASWVWVMGLGATASVTAAMTATFSVTGTTPTITQYLGDLAPQVPKDASGNVLPFVIVLACGHNDTTSSDATYTSALLQSTVTALLQSLTSLYPQATIFLVGNMYLPGGSAGSDVTSANTALLAATTAAAPTINGAVPFIDTITTPWMTGTGRAGALTGNGNSDVTCTTDAVHPTVVGHQIYGTRIARAIQALVQKP